MTETTAEAHKNGMQDLLKSQPDDFVRRLAKIVSKNLLVPDTVDDAINLILLHSDSITSILTRIPVTKEIIYNYLHERHVPIISSTDITKKFLIEKILDYWSSTFKEKGDQIAQLPPAQPTSNDNEADFPINQLSRKFTAWFFDIFNKNEFKLNDFWTNCRLMIEEKGVIISYEDEFEANMEADTSEELSSIEATSDTHALTALTDFQNKNHYYCDPNITHDGVQGRTRHGRVIVLACGTFFNADNKKLLGVFDCLIRILRDPFSDNNYKVDYLYLKFDTTVEDFSTVPRLANSMCGEIKNTIALPAPQTAVDRL